MLLIPQPTQHYLFLLVNTVFNPESEGGGGVSLTFGVQKISKTFTILNKFLLKFD